MGSKRLVEVAVLGQETSDGAQPDWVSISDDAADCKTARMVEAAQRAPRDLPCTADLTMHGQQMRLPRRTRLPAAAGGGELRGAGAVTGHSDETSVKTTVKSCDISDRKESFADETLSSAKEEQSGTFPDCSASSSSRPKAETFEGTNAVHSKACNNECSLSSSGSPSSKASLKPPQLANESCEDSSECPSGSLSSPAA